MTETFLYLLTEFPHLNEKQEGVCWRREGCNKCDYDCTLLRELTSELILLALSIPFSILLQKVFSKGES